MFNLLKDQTEAITIYLLNGVRLSNVYIQKLEQDSLMTDTGMIINFTAIATVSPE